jgi:hypothetical protein
VSALIDTIRRLQPANLVRYVPKRYPLSAAAKERAKERWRGKRLLRKQQAIILLGGRCVDCGASFPDHPEVYDFDHARGTKKAGIGKMLQSSWRVLAKELKKCDLVCSNCHRIRTALRAGWPITKTGVSDTPLGNGKQV